MSVLERDEQLAALRQGMDAAATGGGSLVLVSGEAGVGKTTLVRRFAATLENAQLVTGVCDPSPPLPRWGPCSTWRPGWRSLWSISWPPRARDGRGRRRAPAASFAAAPMLLVFEDVHWADQATLELIGFLGRRVERMRALIIATFLQEELAAAEPLTVMGAGRSAERPAGSRL